MSCLSMLFPVVQNYVLNTKNHHLSMKKTSKKNYL